jgi:hypothetical protein
MNADLANNSAYSSYITHNFSNNISHEIFLNANSNWSLFLMCKSSLQFQLPFSKTLFLFIFSNSIYKSVSNSYIFYSNLPFASIVFYFLWIIHLILWTFNLTLNSFSMLDFLFPTERWSFKKLNINWIIIVRCCFKYFSGLVNNVFGSRDRSTRERIFDLF